MTFVDAVKTCFGKYVSFSDRARRPEFWKFVLFLFLASTLLAVVDGLVFGPSIKEGMKQTMSADGNVTAINYRSVEYGNGPLVSIFRLATFLPALAVVWRRLHDTGRPGWYALIPLLVSFAMVLFMFTGIFGVGMMENAGVSQDALRGPAAFIGVTGIIVGVITQAVLSILLIWWLTRPSEAGTNAYGPEPQKSRRLNPEVSK